MRYSNFYFTAFALLFILFQSCGKDSEPVLPPTVEIAAFWENNQQLFVELSYTSYSEEKNIEYVGVCVSYTKENPIREAGTAVYLASDNLQCNFDFVPGKSVYVRPFIEEFDEIAELTKTYYGETISFLTSAKWHFHEPGFFLGYSNRMVEVVNENDLRIFNQHKQYQSTDLGETWTEIADNLPNYAVLFVEFFSDNEAVLVTGSPEEPLYYTSDGGSSWEMKTIVATGSVNTAHFISLERGYVVTNEKRIRSTFNSGESWITVTLPMEDSDEVIQIFAIDEMNAVLGTEEGFIYQTMDGGNSWELKNESSPLEDFEALYFFDINHGLILANEHILETWNGGVTTTENYVSDDFQAHAITFTNSTNGYAMGKNGGKLKTTNGGTSWEVLRPGAGYEIFSQFENFEMHSDSLGIGITEDDYSVLIFSNKEW